MSFDALAPHYRWLEAMLAGNLLQRSRTAFLDRIQEPKQVLIYGEGNGRFLAALCERFPMARITVVDASATMLGLAKQRLMKVGHAVGRVTFVHADALNWQPAPAIFDLIVTHYFLDCFREDQLQDLVACLGRAATPSAQWLLADFKAPMAGWRGLRNRVILRLLYVFFRWATRLPARELTPPDVLLARLGFRLRQRQDFDWGLLHSDWWTRDE